MGRMMGSVLSKYQKIPINKQKWLPFGSLQGVLVEFTPTLSRSEWSYSHISMFPMTS